MRYEVPLTEHAEQVLEDLYAYVAKFDSPKNADCVLERLLKIAESLASPPERGSQPKELRLLGKSPVRCCSSTIGSSIVRSTRKLPFT